MQTDQTGAGDEEGAFALCKRSGKARGQRQRSRTFDREGERPGAIDRTDPDFPDICGNAPTPYSRAGAGAGTRQKRVLAIAGGVDKAQERTGHLVRRAEYIDDLADAPRPQVAETLEAQPGFVGERDKSAVAIFDVAHRQKPDCALGVWIGPQGFWIARNGQNARCAEAWRGDQAHILSGGPDKPAPAREGFVGRVELDVDLLRKTALTLDALQRSPPEPMILHIREFSARLGCTPSLAAATLARLADLGLIEGPGVLEDCWLFRRMTPRGRVFIEEARSDARWAQIKRAYPPSQK